jgi:16S rRNA (uracil1498-N3)-methyltransferase
MKHRYRFLAFPGPDGTWQLDPWEAHHATKVLRLKSGEMVEIFDGQGTGFTGRLLEGSRVEPLEPLKEKTRPPMMGVLPYLKGTGPGGSLRDALASLVEVGASHLFFYLGEGDPREKGFDPKKEEEKYKGVLLAATKQSKRLTIPKIAFFPSLQSSLEAPLSLSKNWLLLDPYGSQGIWESLNEERSFSGVICGPEKGFSHKEERLLESFPLVRVSMGPFILRAYTAGTLSLGILFQSHQLRI